MNILVTGGAGYIGSHTCKLLFELGHKPIVLDNLSNGRSEFVKWGPFIEGDIIDSGLVLTIVHKYKIESVIHFAANAYVGESILNPRKYYNNNVISSISFINTIVDAGIKFIVFSSIRSICDFQPLWIGFGMLSNLFKYCIQCGRWTPIPMIPCH